jgi:hypothetical protein
MGKNKYFCLHVIKVGPKKGQECGKPCMREDGCTRHSQEGRELINYAQRKFRILQEAKKKGIKESDVILPEKPKLDRSYKRYYDQSIPQVKEKLEEKNKIDEIQNRIRNIDINKLTVKFYDNLLEIEKAKNQIEKEKPLNLYGKLSKDEESDSETEISETVLSETEISDTEKTEVTTTTQTEVSDNE